MHRSHTVRSRASDTNVAEHVWRKGPSLHKHVELTAALLTESERSLRQGLVQETCLIVLTVGSPLPFRYPTNFRKASLPNFHHRVGYVAYAATQIAAIYLPRLHMLTQCPRLQTTVPKG